MNALCSAKYDAPEYNDPERSIESGLTWLTSAPTGRRRRNLIKKLIPLYRLPPANQTEAAVKAANDAILSGGLEPYGIPKITNRQVDTLSPIQKHIAAKATESLSEYDFILKSDMTSFSDYRYFSPFYATAQRFQTMNKSVAGFSSIAEVEGIPDLKALCLEIENPLEKVAELRKTAAARHFRAWLEDTACTTPDDAMVNAYLDAISGRNRISESTPRKLTKIVAMAIVGVGAGSAAGYFGGVEAGALVGSTSAIATLAGEKLAEIGSETALAILDGFVLERLIKHRSPRMFFDELKRLRGKHAPDPTP